MKPDSRRSPSNLTSKVRIALGLLAAFAIGSLFDFDPPRHDHFFRRSLLSDGNSLPTAQGKPIMATFFEPVEGGCCGMTEEGHANLVKAWERAWGSYGWETKVLTEADARKHPRFKELEQKLDDAGVNGYNQRCFWRWLAMAMDTDLNGGWMSDYDFFPLMLTAKIGKELGAEPGFKSWSVHVPTLIHADHKSWNVVTNLMIDVVEKDMDVDFISDMYLLKYLYDHYSEDDLGITTWERQTYSGFPFKKRGKEVSFDCAGATMKLGAHLSHHDTHKALDDGIFPTIPGVREGDLGEHMNKRAEAAASMLRTFKETCLKNGEIGVARS
jgi:hypothetical protein